MSWFQADGYVLTGLPAEWEPPGPAGAGRAAAEGLLQDRERDRKLAMLTCLSQHRWMTTTEVEALFFTSSRGAQRQLRRLEEWGLVHRGHRTDPHVGGNWRKYPDLFLLSARGAWVLAHSQRTEPQELIRRAFYAFSNRLHILHGVGVNDFFASLVRASRELPDQGLYHWVGDDSTRRKFQEQGEDIAPDGWGRYLTESEEIYFYLEWDRGTEPSARLRAKAAAADHAGHHVLWVAPSPAREQGIRSALQASNSQGTSWTTHIGQLQEHGPLGEIWQPGPGDGHRQRLTELPGRPRSERQLEDCLGRPGWWLRRPGGTEGM
ncbi:MAG: hypothetical protein DLM67_26050 [Candidatus Nephthysia bennettiae]|nr:MAG: hypothetical protein DLM67_26050 [Candidatus Dormibacteraeota bacterium]